MILLALAMAGFLILSLFVFASSTHRVIAAGKFTIDARINLKKLDNAQKLKVIASANGDTQVKNVTGNDLNSKSTSVSFEFNEKNDVVSVGDRDEYFACAYALNGTNQMESYSCVEGNIEKTNGKNIINIGSGERKTLSKSEHNTIIIPFKFDKTPEIGPIQKGDLFFACVSADELNPPEGTECEHRETSHTGHIHNLVAR